MTIAEQRAEDVGGDGQQWEMEDGRDVADVFGADSTATTRGDYTQYRYADGSCIITAEGGWAVGISLDADGGSDCYCWLDVGSGQHDGGCPRHPTRVASAVRD